ncbi:MAG: hypothetical protein ACJ72A_11360 [Nocardioidaceae bacterium]
MAGLSLSTEVGGRRAREHDVPRAASGLRAVFDFSYYEMSAVRGRIPFRTFQVLLGGLRLLALPVLLLLSALVLRLAAAMIEGRPDIGATLVVLFTAANMYVAGAYLLKEVFSERRFAVAGSPNAGLFRALDLRARDVFTIYCGLRAVLFHAGLAAVDCSFTLVLRRAMGIGMGSAGLLLVLPLALCLASLATSAVMANQHRPTRRVAPRALIVAAALCVAVGWGTAQFVAAPLVEHGLAGDFGRGRAEPLIRLVAAGATVLGVVAGGVLLAQLRRLNTNSFLVRPSTPGSTGTSALLARRWAPLPDLAVLHQELTRSSVYPLVRKNFLVLGAALLVALGVAGSALPTPLLAGAAAPHVPVFVSGSAFVMDLIMIGLVFKVVGPTALAGHFRFQWEELQNSQWRIAANATGYYVLTLLSLAALISALLRVVVGVTTVQPLALAVAVAAAATIGESVLPASTKADGSSTQGTAIALVIVMLAAPAMIAIPAMSLPFDLLRIIYSICLLGGAITCLAHRITTLPSKFGT